jgi:uncharacterized glyoxalase superfamily protein PhnB
MAGKKAAKKAEKKAAKGTAKKAEKKAGKKEKKVAPVPAGYHTITPNLVYKDTAAAIDWYKKAFGAKELSRMPAPDGKSIWHAEIKIGDSILFLNDESPMTASVAPSGPRSTTSGIQLYVKDVDAWVKRAVEAGAKEAMPVADMFWGDRMGAIVDPFGFSWMIASRVKTMTAKQMAAAGAEFAKKFAAQPPPEAQA